MRRFVIALLVLLLVAGGGLWLLRDRLAKRLVESALVTHLGGTPEVESLRLRPWQSRATLTGLHLDGHEDWPLDARIHIQAIDLRYRLASLFRPVVELPHLLLDIEQVTVVLREGETLNPQQWGVARREPRRERPAARPETETPPPSAERDDFADPMARTDPVEPPKATRRARQARDVSIDELTFRLGTLELHEMQPGDTAPHVRTYRLNYERTFTDIENMEEVIQALQTDLAFALVPQLLRDAFSERVDTRAVAETVREHDGDLDDLGRKLDDETKDLQRELRQLRRNLLDR